MGESETQPDGEQPANADQQSPQPVKRRTTSITLHEIKSMKAVTTKPSPAHITILNKLKTMVTDLFSSFASIFSGKKMSQCDLNGHVFPKGVWEGDFPRCSHCNKEIRSAEEMGTR